MSTYVRVPWSIREEPWFSNDRALAEWLRDQLESERLRDRTENHRPYIPERLWTAILDRFSHRCAYCGASGVPLQREHVIPYSKGGASDESNIVPACQPCNQRKFDKVWSVTWP